MSALPITLSIANPATYVAPYIMLLIVCLVVFSICFLKFPSLRTYRTKRNLVIYPVLALVFCLIIFQAYAVSRNPALVACKVDVAGEPQNGLINQLNVTSSINGGEKASFFLVLKSVNASFVVDAAQNHVFVNSTTVKIPFSFSSTGSETKQVQFSIEQEATEFVFFSSVEEHVGHFVVNSLTSWVKFTWNATSGGYTGETCTAVA
jgi:hypothetical protein